MALPGARRRKDSDNQQLCELCPTRISRGGPHRPHGEGRAHVTCISRQTRATAPVSTPIPRTKRPYDQLQSTQQWKRRKQTLVDITNTLQQTGCPLQVLKLHPRPSPAELIHLPTAVREQIRSVPSLHIPSEQTMIACKQLLAQSHATETGTFAGGAFMTDPVRFVSVLCAQSSFIAVGGDAGGSEACHHRALGGLQRGIGPARPQRAGDQQVDQERMQHDHAGSYWRIFRPPCFDHSLSLYP